MSGSLDGSTRISVGKSMGASIGGDSLDRGNGMNGISGISLQV